MRLIALSTLSTFWTTHPETRIALERWAAIVKAADCASMDEVRASFGKVKVGNGERVRFEVAGGDYRLIVAFKFTSQIAFVTFIGTHAEYDRVDALTVSDF